MVKAIESQGTKLAYSTGGSPSSFTDIGNITAINGLGGGAPPVNDVSNLDSTFREKMMGLPDEGQLSVSFNPDPDNAVHQALRTARKNRTRLEFRGTLTDTAPATVAQFFGYVMTFALDVAMGQPVRGSMTIEIDGEVSWS